jgi:hypothetical protein
MMISETKTKIKCEMCDRVFYDNSTFITVVDLFVYAEPCGIDPLDEPIHFCNTTHFAEWVDSMLNTK